MAKTEIKHFKKSVDTVQIPFISNCSVFTNPIGYSKQIVAIQVPKEHTVPEPRESYKTSNCGDGETSNMAGDIPLIS